MQPTLGVAATDTILAHEPAIRLGVFLGVLAAMALWEAAAPCRRREIPRLVRWSNHLALVALDTALVRLVFPLAAVGLALHAEARGFGLLNVIAAPRWLEGLLAILALDLVIYAQHRAFHAVPILWRLHRMHHADTEVDATTGLRFHPIEVAISMAIKLAAVAALGPPAEAVLIFEVLLNATSLFNHADLRLPARLERTLRAVVVTPDLHRIHHSTRRIETDSNFGFNLPWWDRLLGTYRAEPIEPHETMPLGLTRFRDAREQRLDRLLAQPLRGPARDPE